MITLVLALPLLCWMLVARTAEVGRVVGALLGVCVVAEIALAKRWILTDVRFTLLLALVLVTVVALVAGFVVEARRPGVRKLRPVRARAFVGLVMSVVYCVISLLGILFFVVMVSTSGVPARTPSVAGVLPLPADLVVVANRDEGCGSGSSTICTRIVQVGSATGLSDADVTQKLVQHLNQTGGWGLTSDEQYGGWSGSRTDGWLLDSHEVSLGVRTEQGLVTVDIETEDSW